MINICIILICSLSGCKPNDITFETTTSISSDKISGKETEEMLFTSEFEEYLKDYENYDYSPRKAITQEQFQLVLDSQRVVVINDSDIPENYDYEKNIEPRSFELGANKLLILPESAENGTSGDYCYTIRKDGNAEITKYTGNEKNVIVPPEIVGFPVMYVGEFAFAECDEETLSPKETLSRIINEVTLPDTVVAVAANAFMGCKELKKVSLGNNLKYIGSGAFEFCYSLEAINFPELTEVIGLKAFDNSGLTEVIVPKAVRYIGDSAFGSCNKLKKFELAGGKKNIGAGVIAGSAAQEIFFPTDLEILQGYGAFSESNLKKVEYASNMGNDAVIFAEMYRDCQKLEEITLPENITQIGEYAFQNCRKLEEIRIPARVSKIGTWAFTQCYSLKDVYFGSADCVGIGDVGFGGQIRYIHAPSGGNIEQYCSKQLLIKFVAMV